MEESTPRGQRVVALLLLAGALLYGATVRLTRKDFGLPYLHHYDEPAFAGIALGMLKTGDFNPHYFNYPALTTYGCLAVDVLHHHRVPHLPAGGRRSAARDRRPRDPVPVTAARGARRALASPATASLRCRGA